MADDVRRKGVPGGYRIWTTRQRWWGDHYELCPDDMLRELTATRNYQRITELLRSTGTSALELAIRSGSRTGLRIRRLGLEPRAIPPGVPDPCPLPREATGTKGSPQRRDSHM